MEKVPDITSTNNSSLKTFQIVRSHTSMAMAKATSLLWVLIISILLFTHGENDCDCDIANDCYHLGHGFIFSDFADRIRCL